VAALGGDPAGEEERQEPRLARARAGQFAGSRRRTIELRFCSLLRRAAHWTWTGSTVCARGAKQAQGPLAAGGAAVCGDAGRVRALSQGGTSAVQRLPSNPLPGNVGQFGAGRFRGPPSAAPPTPRVKLTGLNLPSSGVQREPAGLVHPGRGWTLRSRWPPPRPSTCGPPGAGATRPPVPECGHTAATVMASIMAPWWVPGSLGRTETRPEPGLVSAATSGGPSRRGSFWRATIPVNGRRSCATACRARPWPWLTHSGRSCPAVAVHVTDPTSVALSPARH